jgi:hypothetical protein
MVSIYFIEVISRVSQTQFLLLTFLAAVVGQLQVSQRHCDHKARNALERNTYLVSNRANRAPAHVFITAEMDTRKH